MELVLPLSISFALTVSLMPFFIGYFNYKKIGQTTREEGPKWHEVKTGTPTMGGTVFVSAILFTLLVSAKLMNLLNGQVWMIWLTFLLFGGIGFIDDFISIFKKQNEGLTAKQKFVAQLLFSGIIILIAIATGVQLVIPMYFFNITSVMLIVVFAFLWITGFSNAVNLTDGLDGLATGLNIIAYSAYFALALRTKNMAVALVCLTVVGALLGFLIYNKKPAKIFMGDVGSLALGAGLAVISMVLNNPWSLLIIGIVFVIETASVILQVASFKLTGKRIFKMSPIHHHFEMDGWSEQKVVTVFWAVGMLAAGFYYMIF
ncbi:phospho-N-acetylmuramoyl-pentapeptide-transferase [Aerococcaceae bacterium NML130460]|nr:phospho-N-acetylmuramoyl-pentapeptide-transferase [Aerococcaceae bacterium NML171108]MCW6679600.1 phospho-N-acetylmuramoyl-pentapeptide-transferase [Aerococcaceae bacterium NML130460]